MISRGLNYQRTKPSLRIYRGYDPLNPRGLSAEYPVSAALVDTIKEGMIIYPKWISANSRTEWVLDGSAEVGRAIPHIALTDANRYDVVQSDRLVGLPCSGDFVLHTGYYDKSVADAQYTHGATLKASTDGKLYLTSTTGELVVAYIVHENLPFDVSAEDNTFTKATEGLSNTKYVIKIQTCFKPVSADYNG